MPDQPKAYHHGDLRAALLQAAEVELVEKGAASFSLRSVAKRAGVSHAAPAHHFGDVNGLLMALAAVGFRRITETMKSHKAAGKQSPSERMIQVGFGYIDFALKNPALFRLMFGEERACITDQTLIANATEAFDQLVSGVQDMKGGDPEKDIAARINISAAWATVHGLAELLIAGSPRYLAEATEDQRQIMVREIISRSLR